MKTIFIETYGCAANQNNSEILAGLLTQAGYIITNNEDLADIIILNTCVVKERTETKIKRRIQDLKIFSRNKLLIITGCMPETDAKQMKKINPNAVFLGTHHVKDVVKLINDVNQGKIDWEKQDKYLIEDKEIKLNVPKLPQNKLISINQISEGCLGNCTYCKTRLAKGKLFSYNQKDIVKSVEHDLQQGAKEVWITSQDNASYGLDWSKSKEGLHLGKTLVSLDKDNAAYGLDWGKSKEGSQKGKRQLSNLLSSILKLKHRFKLRLGMMDPNNVLPILDELIEIYKDKKMYKFLHIPIQSASNKVLKDMNRFYTIEEAIKIIDKFKKEIPDCVIATDLIVAYPTETDKDHKASLNFLKKYKPSILNLSRFTSHKQTPAGRLKELPTKIAKQRIKELMQIHKETALENKQKYLNKTIKVFINNKIGENLHKARDENYNIILLKCDKTMLGKEVDVKIKELGVHHMIGEINF